MVTYLPPLRGSQSGEESEEATTPLLFGRFPKWGGIRKGHITLDVSGSQ